jgi:hypothetical protein
VTDFHPWPKPEKRVKPPRERKRQKSGWIKPNHKRLAKRRIVDFGGDEYARYIASLPCKLCGIHGYSVPAHVGKARGAGGKAIAPLCASRIGVVGCHELHDLYPWKLPEGTKETLKAYAAELRQHYLKSQEQIA